MMDPNAIRERIRESARVKEALLEQADLLHRMSQVWIEALRQDHKILFFGNGGSAADAQHMACELAGRFYLDRRALPALALSTNTSSLTAIGNDYEFGRIFSRQIEALGRPGDVAVGFSTSGNSPNVLEAVELARSSGLVTMGLTGRRGGQLRERVDFWLPIDSDDTPRIQEGHVLAGHILCEAAERALFGEAGTEA